jgi:hydrogenase assembly chaperone HypC/HupF
MCLTYPAEVVALDGGNAVVRTDGRLRQANTLALPDVTVGDWVIVAAGSIVSRLEPAEADRVGRLIRLAQDGQGARS